MTCPECHSSNIGEDSPEFGMVAYECYECGYRWQETMSDCQLFDDTEVKP